MMKKREQLNPLFWYVHFIVQFMVSLFYNEIAYLEYC